MDDPNPQARADALSYKLRKEAFVSNLSGSSLTDVNLVTLVAASAILLWSALSKRGFIDNSDSTLIYLIDFLLNVCAILFAFTAYASIPIFLNLALIVPAILLLLPLQGAQQNASQKNKSGAKQSIRAANNGKSDGVLKSGTLIVRPFLTNYRGAMLIATSMAILAVDFPVFPRRFAKVETWGTSIMDLGVGSFVFSAGVVGARPVIRETQEIRSQKSAGGIVQRFIKALRHSLPLLILGIARLVSVKNLEYAEHITEYGVHWNFFFTLALLPPFVEAVDSCLALVRGVSTVSGSRSIRYDMVALLIITVYEVIMNTTRLLPFILVAPRTPESDLLTKNREGIFSFIGYLAIFLAGRSTGILVCQFQAKPSNKTSTMKYGQSSTDAESQLISQERQRVILPQLFVRATAYALLYALVTSVYTVNLTVSRRLANLPYVLWVVAFNNAQLFLFALMEAIGPRFTFSKHSLHTSNALNASSRGNDIMAASDIASPIMRAFNSNGLALFLVANLGTGLVNLTLNTLDMGDAQAMVVLITYAAALSLIAVGLNRAGLRLKI